jgi:hypothetical protein
MSSITTSSAAWPDISVAGWAPTKRTLHLCSQMLGKLRVALSPPQPNWMFTRLHLTAHGFATGALPCHEASVDAELDVFAAEIVVRHSSGGSRRIPLLPVRTIAEVYRDFLAALVALGVDCALSSVPQEIPDTTPLDADQRSAEYDPTAAQRWLHATIATADAFERWRSQFFGRSGVQLWWGAFDVALILFNGRHATPPAGSGYLLKYDLDAELMNCGLFLGDETTAPFYFGYIYPQPAGAETFAMTPAGVTWSTTLREWVLPYDAVRTATAPADEIHAFLDAIYAHCISDAGWDRAALLYDAPHTPGALRA